MSATVDIQLFANGPGSDPDKQNCILHLSPSIWVNQGGWWGTRSGVISDRGSGAWRQSRVAPSTIIGATTQDDSDQIFQLNDVPSPMTVNKSGTGAIFKAGNQMPDGPVRWQIVQITSSGGSTALGGGSDDDDS